MLEKKIVVFLASLLLASPALASTVSQSSFQDLGLSEFANSSPASTECQEFPFFKDLNQNTPDFYTVVSLHVLFEPVASDDANVTVFWNPSDSDAEEPLTIAKATEFENNWLRVTIPNQQLHEQNVGRVCLSNSFSTTRTTLLADSLYGTYTMAEFKEGDFAKTVSSPNPILGEDFTVTVSLHNSGSEPVDVNILYEKPGISFKHLPFVKGETSFVGSVQPNQTVSFTYIVKPTKTGLFVLPAAIVFFTNEFGEAKKLVSNYPRIEVVEPEIKVRSIVLNKSIEQKHVVGKPIPFQVSLTNNGANAISNIAVIFPKSSGLQTEPQSQALSSLRPGESKTADFVLTPLQAGSFEAACKIAYLDFEISGSDCESSHFFVEEQSFPIEWIGGIVLLLIAVLVYLYYHFK